MHNSPTACMRNFRSLDGVNSLIRYIWNMFIQRCKRISLDWKHFSSFGSVFFFYGVKTFVILFYLCAFGRRKYSVAGIGWTEILMFNSSSNSAFHAYKLIVIICNLWIWRHSFSATERSVKKSAMASFLFLWDCDGFPSQFSVAANTCSTLVHCMNKQNMYPLNNVVRHPNSLYFYTYVVARLPTAYRTTTYSKNMHHIHIEYGICYCVLASDALFLIQFVFTFRFCRIMWASVWLAR